MDSVFELRYFRSSLCSNVSPEIEDCRKRASHSSDDADTYCENLEGRETLLHLNHIYKERT